MDYTKEFENWWAATYLDKLSNLQPIMIDSYKELAYTVWQHQQTKIDELYQIKEDLENLAGNLSYDISLLNSSD